MPFCCVLNLRIISSSAHENDFARSLKIILWNLIFKWTIGIYKFSNFTQLLFFSRWGNTRTRVPPAQEEDNSFTVINYELSSNYCSENLKFKCEICAGVRQSGVNYLH